MTNEWFLKGEWAKDHAATVDRLPLAERFALTYLPEALRTAASVLDVGCGGGQLRRYVTELNPATAYYGTDFSAASIHEARQRLDRNSLVQADGARLPFASASIDVVYQHDVLMHHPQPLEMLDEMYRVCRRAVVFNARMSPRLDRVLTLEDREHSVQYQTLPFLAAMRQLLDSSPPPAHIFFRVVEIIGLHPTRFAWTTRPHYRKLLGLGRQFEVHAVVHKGVAGTVSGVTNETPLLLWLAMLAIAGPGRLASYLTSFPLR